MNDAEVLLELSRLMRLCGTLARKHSHTRINRDSGEEIARQLEEIAAKLDNLGDPQSEMTVGEDRRGTVVRLR